VPRWSGTEASTQGRAWQGLLELFAEIVETIRFCFIDGCTDRRRFVRDDRLPRSA
jgi:hypothetical protein